MTPDDLIAALETAECGTRELGRSCLLAIGFKLVRMTERRIDLGPDEFETTEKWCDPDGEVHWEFCQEPDFTTDLNVSLPKTPNNVAWEICSVRFDDYTRWLATLHVLGESRGQYAGYARTERLARCIAELKAILGGMT